MILSFLRSFSSRLLFYQPREWRPGWPAPGPGVCKYGPLRSFQRWGPDLFLKLSWTWDVEKASFRTCYNSSLSILYILLLFCNPLHSTSIVSRMELESRANPSEARAVWPGPSFHCTDTDVHIGFRPPLSSVGLKAWRRTRPQPNSDCFPKGLRSERTVGAAA